MNWKVVLSCLLAAATAYIGRLFFQAVWLLKEIHQIERDIRKTEVEQQTITEAINEMLLEAANLRNTSDEPLSPENLARLRDVEEDLQKTLRRHQEQIAQTAAQRARIEAIKRKLNITRSYLTNSVGEER